MVTFSIEEFSSISQTKRFLILCSELAYLKLDTNLHYQTASNYLVRSKFEKPWLLRLRYFDQNKDKNIEAKKNKNKTWA